MKDIQLDLIAISIVLVIFSPWFAAKAIVWFITRRRDRPFLQERRINRDPRLRRAMLLRLLNVRGK